MGLKRAFLVLILAAFIPFARSLLLGAGILDSDVFLQSLPAWEWLGRSLRSGESLLWSPEMMGGFPIAFTQYPFLYPPDLLLAWVLEPVRAYTASLVLHLFAAGAFTYLYCRRTGVDPWGSLLAALSFQMSTEVVAGSSGFAARSAYAIPGLLFAIELVLEKGWRRGAILAGMVATALLGGHAQLILLALMAGGAYALFRLIKIGVKLSPALAAKRAGWLIAAAVVGVAGASVRLLPTWEVVGLSTRAGGLPEGVGGGGALTVHGLLIGFLLPLSRLETLTWGAPGYAGPVALALVGLALPRLASRPVATFLMSLGLAAALLSLGDATPMYQVARLPLLSLFREPARLSLATTFALSVLGGTALHQWRQEKGAPSQAIRRRLAVLMASTVGAVAAIFVLGGLFQFGSGTISETLRSWSGQGNLDTLNPLRPRMALALLGLPSTLLVAMLMRLRRISPQLGSGLLVAISFAVLVALATILNPTFDAEVLQRPPRAVEYLSAQGLESRVFSHRPGVRLYNHTNYYGPGPEEGFTDDLRYRFQAEMLAPIINLRWGLSSADGYEQLHSQYQETLLHYIDSERASGWSSLPGKWAHLTMEQRLRVLRMLGVRYLLSATNLSGDVPGLRLIERFDVAPGPISRAAPSVFLLELTDPLPQNYFVRFQRQYDTDTDALDAIALGDVDPGCSVLLSGDVSAPTSVTTNSGSCPVERETVEVVSNHNEELTLKVSTQGSGYLVSSDAFWPGWRAYLDGREVPLLRANVGGRAVFLEGAGIHTVVFHFVPQGFSEGLAVSVAGALAVLLWLGLSLARRPQRVELG